MADATSSAVLTLADELNKANPQTLADALRKVGLGTLFSPLKVTFSGLTSAAAIDITTAASKAAATVNQGLPGPVDVGASALTLPPILAFVAGRITAGTAHTLSFVVTDVGGTPLDPASGIALATLSDDGKTLTFGAAVTGFVLEYIPRSDSDPMGTQFVPNAKA